jgi:DNA-binding NarL/FixJ family response regulator
VGVILDIIMPPGILFEDNKRAEEGLRTGILLYELIRTLDPKIPILFLSNVTERGVIADLNSRPATKFVSKSETLPSDLSDELKTFFKLS